jgi:hypothetical protein
LGARADAPGIRLRRLLRDQMRESVPTHCGRPSVMSSDGSPPGLTRLSCRSPTSG